jgi:plastocyanin
MIRPRVSNRPTLSAVIVVILAAGCGSKTAPSNSPPVATTTITITSSGVNPKNAQISVGQRVLFVNSDNRSHNMTSDPHPEHTDCPELNQVGFLNAGQSRETGNLVTARTCGFHDHDNPDSASLKGSIVIR